MSAHVFATGSRPKARTTKKRLLESAAHCAPEDESESSSSEIVSADEDDDEPPLPSSQRRPKKSKHASRAAGIRGPPTGGGLLLSRAQVLDLIGVTYTSLWSWMRRGEFPSAIILGPPNGKRSRIAWHASEVYAWIADRPRRELRAPTIKSNDRGGAR
jgi:predicted DNA-binding transcriptional regulator AlpA